MVDSDVVFHIRGIEYRWTAKDIAELRRCVKLAMDDMSKERRAITEDFLVNCLSKDEICNKYKSDQNMVDDALAKAFNNIKDRISENYDYNIYAPELYRCYRWFLFICAPGGDNSLKSLNDEQKIRNHILDPRAPFNKYEQFLNLKDVLAVDRISTYDKIWVKELGAFLETLPEDFDALRKELAGASHAARQAIAKRLQPSLNAAIQAMPSETLDQKKTICDFVADTLEPLGLAVECPNTGGLPGKLKATTGHWPGKGRFHFETYVEGKLKKPAVSDTLPELTLIDSVPPKNEVGVTTGKPETQWQDSVGSKATRTGRKLD